MNSLVGFLGESSAWQIAFEINWPLGFSRFSAIFKLIFVSNCVFRDYKIASLDFFWFLITLYTEYTLVMYLALKQFIAIISCHDSDVKHLSRSHKNSVPMWFDEILRCASPPPDGASELPIAAPPGHLAARHGSCLPALAKDFPNKTIRQE